MLGDIELDFVGRPSCSRLGGHLLIAASWRCQLAWSFLKDSFRQEHVLPELPRCVAVSQMDAATVLLRVKLTLQLGLREEDA